VLCCQVEVSASGRSLVQRSPAERGGSKCDREASIMRPWPTSDGDVMQKKLAASILLRIMYRKIHSDTYNYNFSFFISCTEYHRPIFLKFPASHKRFSRLHYKIPNFPFLPGNYPLHRSTLNRLPKRPSNFSLLDMRNNTSALFNTVPVFSLLKTVSFRCIFWYISKIL
jgi:hypothetical protein